MAENWLGQEPSKKDVRKLFWGYIRQNFLKNNLLILINFSPNIVTTKIVHNKLESLGG
jgi:hypothetical protein